MILGSSYGQYVTYPLSNACGVRNYHRENDILVEKMQIQLFHLIYLQVLYSVLKSGLKISVICLNIA